jgi:hypothetical protein
MFELRAKRWLLVVSIFFLTRPIPGAIIDTKTISATGHVYHLLAPSTWTEAEAEAVSLGGHLVTVNDAAEDTWLGEAFGFKHFFIGLNDVAEEDAFVWSSGESVVYANWQPGEPNNAGKLEHFASKEYCCGHTGDWNDVKELPVSLVHGVVEIASLGDVNFDGDVNGLDVDPFVDVLLNGSDDNATQVMADMNSDGEVNGLDVEPFVAAVVGGVQQIPEPSTLLLCILALGVVGGWRKWKTDGRLSDSGR